MSRLVNSRHFLSIDLSSEPSSISLFREDVLLEEYLFPLAQRQSERLIPELAALLERHNLELKEISKLITTRGPGSFTGMRIAYTTIKAFARSHPVEVEVVEGSEALALQHSFEGNLTVVTRIASQKYYICEFRKSGDRAEKLKERITDTAPNDGQVILNGVDHFPLRSSYLVTTLEKNSSRKTYHTWEDIKVLEPLYLGDSRFQ